MITRYPRILFVEDEIPLAEIIKESLEARGFTIIHFATGSALLEEFYQSRPDLVILDVMLPDTDGFALARQIRDTDSTTPILFLTAKSLPEDVVNGFQSGGNDYLKKPFSIEELSIRIKSLLKTIQAVDQQRHRSSLLQIGQYNFDHQYQQLSIDDNTFHLTSRENTLLKLLVLNKNQVVERRTILLHVWQTDDFFAGRSLDVFITKLRKLLARDPSVQILNARGIGYKFIC